MTTHTIYEKMTLFYFFFFYGDAGHDTLAYAYNACSMYSWILCLYHEHYNDDLCLAFAD